MRRPAVFIDSSHRARPRHAHERDDAVRAYRDVEERVDHLVQTRRLQEKTGGLQAFIPFGFHPDNNQMRKLPPPSASETLRVMRWRGWCSTTSMTSRRYWISCGVEVAQTAPWFGADDLDGTVQEEVIIHMAGSSTPTALSTDDIEQLIRDAGREPIERDTLYNVVRVPARLR